jgi:hypothetical protein
VGYSDVQSARLGQGSLGLKDSRLVRANHMDGNLPPLRNIELRLAGVDQKADRKHDTWHGSHGYTSLTRLRGPDMKT